MALSEGRLDPEIATVVAQMPAPNLRDLAGSREMARSYEDAVLAGIDTTGVAVSTRRVHDPAGGPGVEVRIYSPEQHVSPDAAVLFIHGGGFVVGTMDMDADVVVDLCREVPAVVVSVDYRLAPEHPYPAPLDDCYLALEWLHASAQEFGVDPERIAVVGISAGGNLAAGLALLARDRGGPPICFQFLGIPVLDDRLDTPSMHEFAVGPGWDRASAELGWAAYLSGLGTGAEVPIYAAPSRATLDQLRDAPPAYVSTMEADPVRDEGLRYALRLLEAGVTVEVHNFPGAFHGATLVAPTTHVAVQESRERTAVLRRGLAR